MFNHYLLLLVISFLWCHFCHGNPTVKLKQGKIQGTHKRSYDGRIFSSFEGIPYAKPPVGNLRFKEPIPALGWENILIANKSYLCSQLDETQSVYGTEDCLYIYVHVPKEHINRDDNFDVVVHIHGGSLVFGSPHKMALPDYLMDKNLILVSFNYRLGAAGFLSTGDAIVPGNNGFKDQSLALKWIKSNIRDFGGNPNSVTITGFSAGATSVEFHYISPLSRGLFHKGFSCSNALTNPEGLTPIPLEKTKRLAQLVQCQTEPTKNMIDCLRNVPIEKFVTITEIWFKPAVEKGCSNPFIPDIPYKMLKEKKVHDVPWVASSTIDESLISLDSVHKNRSEIFSICNNWIEWGTRNLDIEDYVDKDKLERTLEEIKKFYMNSCNLTEENGLEKLNRLLTHRHFHLGMDLAIRTQAASTKSHVYYYLFKFIPEDRLEFFGGPAASHGVDIKLLFKYSTNPDKLKPQGEKMMRLFTEFMAEFAKTGVPKIGNVTWSPIDPHQGNLDILEINSPENIKMIKMKELVPRKFWNSLPIKENERLLI